MDFHNLVLKERKLWHKHFIPALFAGLAAGIVSFFYQATPSNIVLFASVGASAIILTHSKSHHLTKLHTTIKAYIVAILVSIIMFYIKKLVVLHLSFQIFLVIFFVGIAILMLDAFHPPSISVSISFILTNHQISELLILFTQILVLLVIVRLVTYLFSQHLPIQEFLGEFIEWKQ